jgi:uncharacterized protein (TIGR00290 family)
MSPSLKEKAWIAWSCGKDSLWALHAARQSNSIDVVGLLTTVTRDYQRVSMHGVREELLEAQAAVLGLPLYRVLIPKSCTNEAYEESMRQAMEDAERAGVTQVVFGDLFLEDVRAYRVKQFASVAIEPCFPLWGRDTAALAREMIAGGVRALVTCLDPRKMGRELAGRSFDLEFLSLLAEGVDPCGENGEFHTFVWDGPGFAHPLGVRVGETVEREGFVFTDVLPVWGREGNGETERTGVTA